MVILTKIKCVSDVWVHSVVLGHPNLDGRFVETRSMSQELSRRALFRRLSPVQEPVPQGPRVAVLGEGCLAVRGITCASCVDPCEPGALKIRPMLGGRGLPTIDAAACTGCGDCLNVCPVGALSLARAEIGGSTPCA